MDVSGNEVKTPQKKSARKIATKAAHTKASVKAQEAIRKKDGPADVEWVDYYCIYYKQFYLKLLQEIEEEYTQKGDE